MATISGLTSGTDYYVRVIAVYKDGTKAMSEWNKFTTPGKKYNIYVTRYGYLYCVLYNWPGSSEPTLSYIEFFYTHHGCCLTPAGERMEKLT